VRSPANGEDEYSTVLKFEIRNTDTEDPVRLPEFEFSFFDLDFSESVGEKLMIAGHSSAVFDKNNTEAMVHWDFPIFYAEATHFGVKCDNPRNPWELDDPYPCENNNNLKTVNIKHSHETVSYALV